MSLSGYNIAESKKYSLASEKVYDDLMSVHGGLFPGIYRLHVLDENGEFLPVARLLGPDLFGTIYIGTSAVVPNRVGSMRKSIIGAYGIVAPKIYPKPDYITAGPHQTGMKILKIPQFVSKFPLQNLCVTIERYERNALVEAGIDYGYYQLEVKLLQSYAEQFGERPALNG